MSASSGNDDLADKIRQLQAIVLSLAADKVAERGSKFTLAEVCDRLGIDIGDARERARWMAAGSVPTGLETLRFSVVFSAVANEWVATVVGHVNDDDPWVPRDRRHRGLSWLASTPQAALAGLLVRLENTIKGENTVKGGAGRASHTIEDFRLGRAVFYIENSGFSVGDIAELLCCEEEDIRNSLRLGEANPSPGPAEIMMLKARGDLTVVTRYERPREP